MWAECEIPADKFYQFPRPKHQGGECIIAEAIKVNRVLQQHEVEALR